MLIIIKYQTDRFRIKYGMTQIVILSKAKDLWQILHEILRQAEQSEFLYGIHAG